MNLAFYWIPARHGESAQEELNRALRGLRVIGVEKHFCPGPGDPGWAICVEHAESARPTSREGSADKRVDYREILDAETFRLYAALRACRKDLAMEDSVPIYAILSNEQLAAMARQRCASVEAVKAIDGVGDARARKYGPRLLDALREAMAQSGTQAGNQETAQSVHDE